MVLEKVCGEANRTLFMGFTDLFQEIANALIPDFWPFSVFQDIFNNIFDKLQEQMKPFAYRQGERMGAEIEAKATAMIRTKFNEAMSELNKVKNQALSEIASAENELSKHAAEIQNLIERVNILESRGILGALGGLIPSE